MTTIEIFKKMLDWLRANVDSVKNQTDVARAAGLNETTASRIMNGQVKSVKQETLWKVNAAYGNPFNPEWLRGESDVMLLADVKHSPTPPSPSSFAGAASAESPAAASVPGAIPADAPTRSLSPSGLDPIAAALLASKDETIAALRAQLANTIAAKEETIAAMKSEIATKDALISNLQQQLLSLRTQTAIEKGVLTHGTSPSAPVDYPSQRKNP